MKSLLVLSVVAVLCLSFVPVARAGVLEDSVLLDRSYVPALALTNQKDKPQALVEESIRRFSAAWEKFTASVLSDERGKTVFESAIEKSSPKVADAARLAAAGKRKDAHEALETVRLTFKKARIDSGITYLPDLFTAFHEPMEEFAESLSARNPDRAELRRQLDHLSKLWTDVEKAGLDNNLFGVGPEKAAKYAGLVGKEREALTQIEGLVASGSQEELTRGAAAMKGYFAQAYFVFGDFSGL